MYYPDKVIRCSFGIIINKLKYVNRCFKKIERAYLFICTMYILSFLLFLLFRSDSGVIHVFIVWIVNRVWWEIVHLLFELYVHIPDRIWNGILLVRSCDKTAAQTPFRNVQYIQVAKIHNLCINRSHNFKWRDFFCILHFHTPTRSNIHMPILFILFVYTGNIVDCMVAISIWFISQTHTHYAFALSLSLFVSVCFRLPNADSAESVKERVDLKMPFIRWDVKFSKFYCRSSKMYMVLINKQCEEKSRPKDRASSIDAACSLPMLHQIRLHNITKPLPIVYIVAFIVCICWVDGR